MADDDDMVIHRPLFPQTQYLSMICANDISSDDDFPVVTKTPAIAPMRFEGSLKSQPLRRRFFSTGGNQKQRGQLGKPLTKLD